MKGPSGVIKGANLDTMLFIYLFIYCYDLIKKAQTLEALKSYGFCVSWASALRDAV